jgi:hypothetical protein
MSITYYFTIYGEVYSGEEFDEPAFPNHKIIIQRTKIREYNSLNYVDKTLEKIGEFGWALPKNIIANTIKLTKEESDSLRNRQTTKSWYQYDRKIMFLFGAGASANCVFGAEKEHYKKDVLCSPLGTALFDKKFESLYRKYPGAIEALHFLQEENGTDVEALLEDEWEEISQFGNELIIRRHINIQYYLQELLKTISQHVYYKYNSKNLFAVMADKLSKKYHRNKNFKPSFVSFNQDTILDKFLGKYFDLTFSSLEDYVRVNENPFCLFKPHGSWNWGWQFSDLESKSITTAQWLFQDKVNYHKLYFELLGDYRNMLDWESYSIEYQMSRNNIGKHKVNKSNLSVIIPGNENMYFPALLLPYRDKDEFTMPSSHYWDLQQCVGYAETLIIIGWKGNEFYFNKLLQFNANNIKKIIVADPSPEYVKTQLSFFINKGVEIVEYLGGFEDFVLNGLDKELS